MIIMVRPRPSSPPSPPCARPFAPPKKLLGLGGRERATPGRACTAQFGRACTQTILGNLIGSEYEYLMKGTLRHEHAEKAAAACTSAAIMYGATLIASCVCICTDRGDGKQAPGKE